MQRLLKLSKMNLMIMVAMILMFTMILTACGTNKSGSESSAASTQAPASDASGKETASASEVRKIKHAMGETEVKGTPQRVVILTNEGTEALLELGVKPVGAVKSWTGDPWYEHIKDDMQGVAVVGDEMQPNLEQIASLKPDLIIGSKVRQEKVYQQLSAIAPTVFSETFSGNWKTNFLLYAEALNKKAEGEKAIADFDKRVADLKAKLGDKTSAKVSVVRFLPGKARIYNKDSFSGVLLSQLGFARPESQNKPTLADEVTKERIPEMDGDILFYFVWEDDPQAKTGAKTAEEWKKDPLWNNLNVVKQNKAFEVSDAVWNTAGGIKAANLMLEQLASYFK